MGYSTGVANNPSDLIAALVAACVTDGWTNSGSVLSKGNCHTRLTSPAANQVMVEGANDALFATVCPWAGYVNITNWPVTYRIWVNTAPDSCFMHIRKADGVRYEFITFGEIEDKVGTWVGGNFFAAPRTGVGASVGAETQVPIYKGGSNSSSMFANMIAAPFGGGSGVSGQGMHMELNGNVWADGAYDTSGNPDHVHWPSFQTPINIWQPNQWNGQALLLRMHLYSNQASGRYSKIGSFPHMRALRITNYEPYDIITLGEEQWMVAPWSKKDTVNIDGQTSGGSSGTHGFAIRYVP